MSLFSFFHKDEKKELINAVQKRKKNLLKLVHNLFKEEKQLNSLVALENNLLKSINDLNSRELSAVNKVLADDRTEEQILDYLAKIENEIVALIDSGDVEAIRTRLKKYIHTTNQLSKKLDDLELSKKAQLIRIKAEKKKLLTEAEKNAYSKNIKQIEEQKSALKLMEQSIKVQNKENKFARKKFFQHLTELGIKSTKLINILLKVTAEVAKASNYVAKIGTTGSKALYKSVNRKLK